jgi:hypothetical protein
LVDDTNNQRSPRTQSTTENKIINLENENEKQHNQMVKFRKDLVRTYTTVVDLTEEVNQIREFSQYVACDQERFLLCSMPLK